MLPSARCLTLATVLAAAACHRSATLDVTVRDHGAAVPGVTLTVRSPTGAPLGSGSSSSPRSLSFRGLPPGPVVVEALLVADDRAGYAARRITLDPGRNATTFELGRDLVLTPLVRAEDPPARTGSLALLPELAADRRVKAILEIDWVEGLRRPRLAVETTEGALRLEDILAEVGLDVTAVWSDVVPATELGPGWPGEARLADVLTRHRDVPIPEGAWHLHLLLAPQPDPNLNLSLMVDPARRTGAVVLLPPSALGAQALHAVLHEVGHLLNLPHPWELGADTRSAMSYPWRWPDWDWADPSVYRFDAAARRHLLRAPDQCVRPGGGPFGACWMTRSSAE